MQIAFSPEAFDRSGQLWFYWTVLAATPPITIQFPSNDSSVATIKKAAGNGNMNAFTIEVEVWEEVVVSPTQTDTIFVAKYLVISDGGAITVTLEP